MSEESHQRWPGRRRPGTWLMALLRLGAGWLIIARAVVLLLTPPSPLASSLSLPLRIATLSALGAGLLGFAWPRSCLWGLALLGAALGAFELLARSLGLPPTPRLPSAIAILAVLAAGEWLTRRVQRRR